MSILKQQKINVSSKAFTYKTCLHKIRHSYGIPAVAYTLHCSKILRWIAFHSPLCMISQSDSTFTPQGPTDPIPIQAATSGLIFLLHLKYIYVSADVREKASIIISVSFASIGAFCLPLSLKLKPHMHVCCVGSKPCQHKCQIWSS